MGKVRLNDDQEVVALIREGLKRTGGYCPCRLARTPENKCMCKEFRDQIAGTPNSRATATAAFTTKKNKPSHRVRGAAAPRKECPIRFCGGVYVAKNTLRWPQPKGTGLGRPDG